MGKKEFERSDRAMKLQMDSDREALKKLDSLKLRSISEKVTNRQKREGFMFPESN